MIVYLPNNVGPNFPIIAIDLHLLFWYAANMTGHIDYNPRDVDRLASAILADWVTSAPIGPWQSYVTLCRHCGAQSTSGSPLDVTHEPDCVVLVAQDVLTKRPGGAT